MMKVGIRWAGSILLACVVLVIMAYAAGRILPAEAELIFSATSISHNSQIYRTALARQMSVPITANNTISFSPSWSPDGQNVAFVGQYQSQYQIVRNIFLMSISGAHIRQITKSFSLDVEPAWSPDGKTIAFSRISGDNSKTDLMLYNLDSGIIQPLTANLRGYVYNQTWSSDSRQLAFVMTSADNSSINSLDIASGQITSLVKLPHLLFIRDIAWSPDSRYLLYVADNPDPAIYLWDRTQDDTYLLYQIPNPDTRASKMMLGWGDGEDSLIFLAPETTLRNRRKLGIFQLNIADCLQQPQQCNPDLLMTVPQSSTISVDSARWRPQTP
ncbi:MAG: hypothetical protein GC179_10695 [Anaerolineaceae bacterium]|nr:hypothetical protein [Anaerolineaceae bacterium]